MSLYGISQLTSFGICINFWSNAASKLLAIITTSYSQRKTEMENISLHFKLQLFTDISGFIVGVTVVEH